jgi:DNA-binding NarL/FixJ family response regulator
VTAEPIPSPVRVVVVDDHALLGQSLAVALGLEGHLATVADLHDGDALLAGIVADPPDLVLLDLDLGGAIGDGTTLVRPLVNAGVPVLLVSAIDDPCRIGAALEQGAVGAVHKVVPFDVLLRTVVAAAHGCEVMPAQERHRIITELRRAREREHALREPFERLTRREQQVLEELSQGKTVGHIADEWFVSEATVRSQVRGVLTKLGVGSQLEAVAHAMQAGWLNAAR